MPMVSCLICGRPTSVTHMGIDACRACAVCFKRHREKVDELVCANGARSCWTFPRGVFWCRRCRVVRFEDVLKLACGNSTSTSHSENSAQTEQGPSRKCARTPHACKIKRQLEITRALKAPGNPVMDRIRVNHRFLSSFRLSAELTLRGTNQTENESNYELIPSTYQYMNFGTKQLLIGLFPFAESTFPEFRRLSLDEKWQLIRNYANIFHCIDSALRTKRRFGKDSKNCYVSYTTHLSMDTADQFFSDCPDRTHAEVATKTLKSNFLEIFPAVWQEFHQVNPSEDELFALIGLAFWSIETFDASDNLLALATRYRTMIINELTARYRTAIGQEKGASRVGSLLCLLLDLRRVELKMRSVFEIFGMLGTFNDETLAYKLQLMSV